MLILPDVNPPSLAQITLHQKEENEKVEKEEAGTSFLHLYS